MTIHPQSSQSIPGPVSQYGIIYGHGLPQKPQKWFGVASGSNDCCFSHRCMSKLLLLNDHNRQQTAGVFHAAVEWDTRWGLIVRTNWSINHLTTVISSRTASDIDKHSYELGAPPCRPIKRESVALVNFDQTVVDRISKLYIYHCTCELQKTHQCQKLY